MDAGSWNAENAYTAEEAQAMDVWLERECGRTVESLMAVAGRRVAEHAEVMIERHALARAVLLVGPGHNGGDALVAAEHLAARVPCELWRPLAGDDEPDIELDERVLVVDGLFGVGLARPIEGAARAAVARVSASSARVLAVDIPSGISADDGRVVGCTPDHPDGGVAVRADLTVTFVGPKRGFFLGAGPAHVGVWVAVDIGFPVEEADAWLARRRAAREGATG